MKRNLIAMASALMIFAGTIALSTPAPLAAQTEEACCKSGNGAECCGKECSADADSCEACTKWYTCIFF